MPLLDEIAPAAASAGAVNTIAVRDGRWIGMNTDADGFLEPLLVRMPVLTGRRAVVLGAGGAARAVALALRGLGAVVGIAARRDDAARTVAEVWWSRSGRLAAQTRLVGFARQRHARGHRRRARHPLRRVRLTASLSTTCLRPRSDTARARRGDGRVPGDRGTRDARRAGRAPVRDLDRANAARGAVRGSAKRAIE